MTLTEMKKHYFNEATELGCASEDDIERLAVWLEAHDFDADLAWRMWHDAAEELRYMMADLAAEFG